MSQQLPSPPPYGPPPGQPTPQWGHAPQPPKKSKKVPIIIGGVAFVAVLGIIIAAAGSSKKDGTDTPAALQTTPAASTTAPPKATPTPVKKKPTTARYGDTYTYTDGLAISVSKVSRYTPSQYAAGTHPGDEAIVLTVKITNGTGKPFDTNLVGVNAKAGADGAATEPIFDDTSGVGFSGTIVPGSVASARFAFDVPRGAAGNLDIEVQPDSGLEYASWHWVGSMP
jgi:hypothetical protein